MRIRFSIAVAVVLAGSLLGGCRNKFTRVNYESIYVGQDAPSVRKTIGKPDTKTDSEWIYENDRPFYRAVISFSEGAVSDKEWIPSRDALEPSDETPEAD
jgi:hypothetical protein